MLGVSGDRRLLRDGSVLFVAVTAANVSNYVFHVVMTRLLEPDAYGALGALLAVVLVLSVPTGAVQAVIARRAAQAADDPRALAMLVRGSVRLTAIVGVAATCTLVMLSPLTASFFHLESVIPALLLATLLIPASIGPVARGVLQGTMRFRVLGTSILLGMLAKLAFGVLLVQQGYGVAGAIAGAVLGQGVGLAVALFPLRRPAAVAPVGVVDARAIMGETGRAAMALLAFWLLVSLDLMLVRHFHPTEVSGRYAAATLLGRAVLFLPAAITLAVYPRFAERPNSPEARHLLVRSMTLVGALGAAATAGIILFPGLVAGLFGSEYVGQGAVGELLAAAMTTFGVVGLLLHYGLAAKRPPVKTLWAAVAGEAVVVVAVQDSPTAVAGSVLVVGLLLTAWLAFHALKPMRSVSLDASAELLGAPDDGIELTVVTPSFNGTAHIGENLSALSRSLQRASIPHEVILVSDGSTDGTERVAAQAAVDGLRVIHYERNQGKGFALRTGLAEARGRYVAFIDSDGDLDPGELCRFLELMRLYEADLVIGSKRHRMSQVAYPPTRRLMSWGYHLLVRALFGLRVSDTQTGIKLARREALATVLPRLLEKRYAFDLELLVAAQRLGFGRILEAPITLDYRFSSTIRARAVRGILLDTAAIWYRRFVLQWYDRPQPASLPAGASRPVPSPMVVE